MKKTETDWARIFVGAPSEMTTPEFELIVLSHTRTNGTIVNIYSSPVFHIRKENCFTVVLIKAYDGQEIRKKALKLADFLLDKCKQTVMTVQFPDVTFTVEASGCS